MIQDAFLSILTTSFKMSFFILPLLLATPLLEKKYAAKWHYYIWLGIAVYLLIPMPLAFSKAPVQIHTTQILQTVTPKQGMPLVETTLQNMLSQSGISSLSNNSSPSLVTLAALTWLCGVVLFFSFHVLSYLRYAFYIQRWSYMAEGSQLVLFEKVKRELGITKNVTLLRCSRTKSPMLLGVLSPAVIITPCEYDETDLYLILKHELIHLSRNDILAKTIMFFSQTLHWFNPLVHLMAGKWHQIIEMSCDEHVISGEDTILSSRYMNSIVRSVEQAQESHTIFTTHYFGGMTGMKKRLENIARLKNMKNGRGALAIVLLLCIGLSTLVAFNTGAFGDKAISEVSAAKAPTDAAIATAGQTAASLSESVLLPPIGKNIKNVLAESKADPVLEKMIIEELEIPDDFLAMTSYYYNYVDLNQDGSNEVFVVVSGPYTSGSGGSTAIIGIPYEGGYHVNQIFTLIQTPVIISDKITKGCHEIVVRNSGGGAEGNYVSLVSSDGYYTTVNDGTVIEDINSVSGTAILANDMIKDAAEGNVLRLGK